MSQEKLENLAFLLLGFSISGLYYEITVNREMKRLRIAVEKFVDWAIEKRK